MDKIVECVPNFSEGRDENIIRRIAFAIEGSGKVKIRDISSGISANRTVITFVGPPEDVAEAAFRGIEKASELIDMTKHEGVHSRLGATDVCPLIPISGITMDETSELARNLARRVGEELRIPVYCYENSAFYDERRSLANCRKGEYEGLREKMLTERWKPDFGPSQWTDRVAKTGATVIGARKILVAFNVNLDTNSVETAREIAEEIRESGRMVPSCDKSSPGETAVNKSETGGRADYQNNSGLSAEGSGKNIRDGMKNDLSGSGLSGKKVRIPGTLKKVRAIGWYLKDPGITQVSMNILDISVTPVHKVFEEVKRKALEKGCRVSGSELIGLIPLKSMLDAGRYFSEQQNLPADLSDDELINIAVESLGLNALGPFDPKKRIIEYLI